MSLLQLSGPSRAEALRRSGAEDRIETRPRDPAPQEPARRPPGFGGPNRFGSKLLKTTVAGGLLLLAGWVPVRELTASSSTEALLNARLISLKAPIDGEVTYQLAGLRAGILVGSGDALLRIENMRADRSRLDDLARLVRQLEIDQDAASERLVSLAATREGLLAQARAFQEARGRQLEARAAEIESEIASAQAAGVEAEAALSRARELFRLQTGSQQALDRAEKEATSARQAALAARARLASVRVELDAVRSGTFAGDSYNDRPNSLQRADEIALQIDEITTARHERASRIESLKAEIAPETERFADRSTAGILAPAAGRVWEVLTVEGEHVRQGQDLVRLLDCRAVVVTASVSERIYNGLQLGDEAAFRFRDGGRVFAAKVTALTGLASAPANLAIMPSALSKEPYRVALTVPEFADPAACPVGRTGKVVFHPHGQGLSQYLTAIGLP